MDKDRLGINGDRYGRRCIRTNAVTAKMPGKRSTLFARTVWSTWKCITKNRSGGLLFSP